MNTAPSFLKRQPTRMLSRTSCRRSFEGQWTTFSYLWFGASSSTPKNLRSYRRSCKPARAWRRNRNEPNSRKLIRSAAQCASTNWLFCYLGGGLLASRREGESKGSTFLLSRSAALLGGGSGYQHLLAVDPNRSCRESSAASCLGHCRVESPFLELGRSF